MNTLLRVACLAIVFLRPLAAAPIAVGDFSFEVNTGANAGNNLTTGGYHYNLSPEWQETAGPNNSNGFEEFITGFTADGTDHLGMEINHDVWQDLAVTYQPNTRYTLTVATGNRSGNTQAGNQTQYLLTDNTGTVYATGIFNASTLPVGTFADAPALVFDTPANTASLGKTVRILLQSRGGGRSHFDKIRLDATSLIPPGAAVLENQSATAVTNTTATLNGAVTNIGNQAPSITLFWGSTDGGVNAAAWQNSQTLPGTYSGSFSANITGLSASTVWYFTARATNSSGVSWAFDPESFETSPPPPVVANIAATEVGAATAIAGATFSSTGTVLPTVTLYYGPADGGTNPAAWVSSIPLDNSTGDATSLLTGLSSATPYFFRAYAENPGGGTWAPASGTFTTLTLSLPAIENRNADGLTGTTATLRGEVTATGNDNPAVTIFYGTANGGTNPANWASSANAGLQSGDFSQFLTGLSPTTTYFFRCRAVNAAGTAWAPDTRSFTTTPLVPNSAVINEFHYNSLDSTSAEEFIELHNPGDTALNLSGWSLADAVTYTFPNGTTLPAGGYLIVAESPAIILSKYNKTALGPWTGKLSSSGERIDLLDAALVLRDRVTYGVGFPWPTSADGAGNSAELLHPGLDNDLGGSWRSSTFVPIPAFSYITPQATGWKYRKGTSEASSPVDLWRGVGFADSSWSTGQAAFGYGSGVTANTPITDMLATNTLNYQSVYARKSFTVPVGQIPNQLTLKLLVDDACVVWINNTEVYRTANAGSGQLAHNFNPGSGVTGIPTTFTSVNLTNTSAYLIGGTNVLSIHAFNRNSMNHRGDFLFDAELLKPATTSASSSPTPGAANSTAQTVTTIPPQIRQVAHSPVSPTAGQAVTITARITDPDGMGAVTLAYQTVDPGAYIRNTDAAYSTGWTTLTMRDNGFSGDATANDSIYTIRIPANVQTHRRLIRYRISFGDNLGNSATVPYSDDEQPNFAYFAYNGTPAWSGAFIPGSTPVQTFSSTLLNTLPPFQIIANAADINSFQSGSGSRFRAAVVHRGIVHDHVQFRVRGIGSTTVSGKNKWNVYFNRARDFQAYDNLGNPYKETWNNILINANSSPWASVNRGSAGIEEALSNRIYSLAGMASMHSHHLHLRVIDEAAEASSGDQYTGDLWGLYLGLEPTEGNFLDERDLPSGNLYSIEGNGGDKKYQGATQPLDSSDWNAFRDGLAAGGQTEAWYRANVDLPSLYTFLALNRLTGNVDVRPGDNYRFYHRPTDDRWVIIPYDLDMQFIAAHHWSGTMDGVLVPGAPNAIVAIMRHPAIAREFRNRCREILSLMASDATPTGGQIGQLFDEYAQVVNPSGIALTWADLDAAMWNLNPKTKGSLGATSGNTNHKGNFFRANYLDGARGVGGTPSSSWIRTLPDPDGNGFGDHEGMTQWFVNYATNTWPGGTWVRKATSESGGGTDSDPNRQLGYGYKYLEWESLYGGYANASINPLPTDLRNDFPNPPVVTATGDPAFPVSDLSFTSSAFSDPQGGSAAAWQWRIAEISAPGIPGHLAGTARKYEIEPLLTSAELPTSPGGFTVPYGLTSPGKTYRVRVRHKDSSDNWSGWSAPAQFAATTSPPGPLLHYWNFNALNPANLLNVTTTIGGGTLGVTGASEPGSAQGFAAENARNGDHAGNHLRLNNPLGTTVQLALPTPDHENIVVKYETRRSGQGAGTQVISYTVNGTSYLPFTTITLLDDPPVLRVLDFRGIPAANDNPLFGLRITFLQGDGGTAGNNRIDNLTVEGDEIEPVIVPGTYTFWRNQYFPNPADFANEALSGPEATPAGDGIANIVRYAHGVGPYAPVVHLLPVLVKNGAVYQFRFRFDPALTDLVWKVKGSNNLGTWPGTLFDSTVGPVPPLESGWLPVNLPASLTGNPQPDPRIFARLELQLVAP